MKYLSKKDFQKRLWGIEGYRPGDTSAGDLWLRVTSGTSGTGPSVMVRSIREPYVFDWYKSLWDEKTILFALASRSFLISGIRSVVGLFPMRGRQLLVLDHSDIENPALGELLSEFSPRAVMTLHTFFENIALALAARKKAAVLRSIRYLRNLGEPFSQRQFAFFQKIVPRAALDWNYGIGEGGACTALCSVLQEKYPEERLRVFHPLEFIGMHIIAPDERGIGEIGVYLERFGARFRTGDLGKIIEEPCPCGQSRTFIVVGRKDHDIVSCRGALFYRHLIEKILDPLLGTVFDDYRMEVGEVEKNGTVFGTATLVAVVKKGKEASASRALETLGTELYITPTRTLTDLVDGGIFLPPELKKVESILHGQKKVRLRRVIN